jgi:xanthine dehydrogenase molybdopterin-binding subunit B
MKLTINQAARQQLSSRKGGGTGEKKRMNTRVLTVCFTMGKTLMIEIRDYRGGDYGKEQQRDKYAANCVFSKIQNPKTNKSKE